MTSSQVVNLKNEAKWEQANIEAAVNTLRFSFRKLAYPDCAGIYLEKAVGVHSRIILRNCEHEPVMVVKMYTRHAEQYVAALLQEMAYLRAEAKRKEMAA